MWRERVMEKREEEKREKVVRRRTREARGVEKCDRVGGRGFGSEGERDSRGEEKRKQMTGIKKR